MALTFQQQLLVCVSAVCQASKASNAPRQLLRPNLPAGLSKATLAATRPSHLFFRALKLSFPAVKRFKPLPSNPSAGLSKATLAFKGVQDCRLPAFKPLKPSRRPSAGLSKATLAATRPSHLSCVQNSF